MRKIFGGILVVATLVLFCGLETAQAQEKKEKQKTGSVNGVIKSKKDIWSGTNVAIEFLGAGEERARSYRVEWDDVLKKPMPEVLKAVREAKLGDRAQMTWVDTGEGLAITEFKVLKSVRAPEEKAKQRSGNITGVINSKKDIWSGTNVAIEFLGAGEEKARSYWVEWDDVLKKPMPEVLKAVREAKLGDRAQLTWVDTGEGLAITKFEVLKKGTKEKK